MRFTPSSWPSCRIDSLFTSAHFASVHAPVMMSSLLIKQEIDWEATPEKEAAHPYAEMLVKETATLHKVLSKYLASSTVESVLAEVLNSIVTRLTEEYTKIELKSDEARKRYVSFFLCCVLLHATADRLE